MKGFARKSNFQVSEENVFPIYFHSKSGWKLLNRDQHTQNCESLIGLAAKNSLQ